MEELTAKCLGPIWNARDLFLAGVMTENEIAVGSPFSAFDISLWQDEKRDDSALPLAQHCQQYTSLRYAWLPESPVLYTGTRQTGLRQRSEACLRRLGVRLANRTWKIARLHARWQPSAG